MKILAIDSSGMTAAVAVLEDGTLRGEYSVNYRKTHSQTLLPMIDGMNRMLDFAPEDFDAVAVAEGPGSFTGLRIGSATAKGFALALDIPIIPVPTVDGMAYNFFETRGVVVPMMDARRHQVYTGVYRFTDHVMETVLCQRAESVQELAGQINEIGEEAILCGDGLDANRDQFEPLLRVPFCEAPPHLARQRAASVGALAEVLYREGKAVTADEFHPEYLRKSQAERESAARGVDPEKIRSDKLEPTNFV